MKITDLQPQIVWQHFAALNAVPRPSKKEERVIAFMQDFGKSLGLVTETDPAGNVLIRKPATKGYENLEPVILQSHLDMVHQKNDSTQFDFETQGIEMLVAGDWVKANGTTLGADNGLGVAITMAILSDQNLPHGEIEALFTIDEETGMTGAKNLQAPWLNSKYLINLDTEDTGEICIGCAGGIDSTVSFSFSQDEWPDNSKPYALTVSGLQGGHSGVDIILQLGNANKILGRLLNAMYQTKAFQVAEISGGSLRNAIPREAKAVILIEENQVKALEQIFKETATNLHEELASKEPGLEISFGPFNEAEADKALNISDSKKLIQALNAAPNGVFSMDNELANLVETSLNLAKIQWKDGTFTMMFLLRSSINSRKTYLTEVLDSIFHPMGAEVVHENEYSGWKPVPQSELLKSVQTKYADFLGHEPHVSVIHAGLECGIIGGIYPNLEMISVGPTIKGAHSPDERAHIGDLAKFWEFFKSVLVSLPSKQD